jgi:mannitol/fructose-specific phosphotransferase system IIA component
MEYVREDTDLTYIGNFIALPEVLREGETEIVKYIYNT